MERKNSILRLTTLLFFMLFAWNNEAKPQTSNLKPQTLTMLFAENGEAKPQTSNQKPQISNLIAPIPPSLGEGTGVGSSTIALVRELISEAEKKAQTDIFRGKRTAFQQQPIAESILFFGRKLKGTPYVGKTLDRDTDETLVLNLKELDCTTFVENVVALAITFRACQENPLFAANPARLDSMFKHSLQQLRYRGGHISYVDRLHYFTSWIEDNTLKGLVEEISTPNPPFSSTQTLDINFMSTHTNLYPQLVKQPELTSQIAETERNLTGKAVPYIPKSMLKDTVSLRKAINDGDILAIVTNKKGLDTSHIGFAVWKKNGLHLMHASSIKKRVIEDPQLLFDYMKGHPSQIGIRVIRVK